MLSVFLFHLQPRLLPGGFLGVDVFFVISGYLITGIIARENHLGTFSLTHFYARRVKRIFPALFVLLALSSLVAILLLLPETYVNYMKSARYASGQLSNFFFAQTVGYFEEGFFGQPLLHTWSLGVEEQFYLIWPLLIYICYRISQRRQISNWANPPNVIEPRKNLLERNSGAVQADSTGDTTLNSDVGVFLLLLFIASYGLCWHIAGTNANHAFYMFYTRAFEFCIGGFLALGMVRQTGSKALQWLIGWVGLVMIIGSFLLVRQEFIGGSFLRYGTIITCLGTGMLIYCSDSKGMVNKILANRLPASIGKISYSLYLYHWPIIIFWKQYSGDDTLGLATCLSIITAAFILSILSYRFVEQPARKAMLPDRWLLSSALMIIIVFAVSFRVLEEAGIAPWRITQYTNTQSSSDSYSPSCPKRFENGVRVFDCSAEQTLPRPTLALVGDSHSAHYFRAVSEWARHNNYAFKYLGIPGCPMLVGDIAIRSLFDDKHAGQCAKALPKFVQTIVEDPAVELVVIAQRFDLFHDGVSFESENPLMLFLDSTGKPINDHTEYYLKQLQETVKALKDNGKKVILAGQVPLFKNVKECDWQPRLMKGVDWKEVCSYDQDFIRIWQQQSRSFIQEFAEENQVIYFDPFPYFEEPLKNGFNLYNDTDHLSNKGRLYLEPDFSKVLDQARAGTIRDSELRKRITVGLNSHGLPPSSRVLINKKIKERQKCMLIKFERELFLSSLSAR